MAASHPPRITSLRPSVGPTTGETLLMIRGENLGEDARDILDVKVGDVSCRRTLSFDSPYCIYVRTPPGEGTVSVIITTESGGEGVCMVTFSYEPRYLATNWQVDRTLEIDLWREEFEEATAVSIQPGHIENDPLGLGYSVKVKLNPEGNASLDTQDPLFELRRLFPNATSSLSSEAFQPSWLLIERYQKTDLDDFKRGLENLEETVAMHNSTTFNLLNANASVFVECFQALSEVHSQIMQDRQLSENGDIAGRFEASLNRVVKSGEDLFVPLLDRRRTVECDRNALNVLTSYRFLFNLPQSLRRHHRHAAWAQIIQDFKKADTLFRTTTVPAFIKVMSEVDRIMEMVKKSLYELLEKLPSTVQDQERIIGYLNELGVTDDPGWFCLQKQQRFIEEEMTKCLRALESALKRENKGSPVAGASWAKLRAVMSVHRSLSSTRSGPFTAWRTRQQQQQLDQPDTSDSASSSKPSRVVFIENMSRIIVEFLPLLWRLGQLSSSSSSAVAPAGQSASALTSSSSMPAQATRTSGRGAAARRTSIVLPEAFNLEAPSGSVDGTDEQRNRVADMVFGILSTYCTHVREQFMEEDEEGARDWMPHCESHIRACHRGLTAVGLPRRAIVLLDTLLSDLHQHTVTAIFTHAKKEISQSMLQETWVPEAHCTHTRLPAFFAQALRSAFATLQDLMSGSTVPATALAEKMVERLFCDCVDAMALLLSTAASSLAAEPVVNSLTLRIDAASESSQKQQQQQQRNEPTVEYKLTCLLANTLFCREQCIPELLTRFAALQLTPGTAVKKSVGALATLQETIFNSLLDRYGSVIKKLLDGCTADTWSLLVPSTTPRAYLRHVLMAMVTVHASTHAAARPFVFRVLSTLVRMTADHVRSIFADLPKLEPHCLILLQVELLVMKDVLTLFDDEHSSVWLPAIEALQSAPVLARTSTSRQLPTAPSSSSKRALPAVPQKAERAQAYIRFDRLSKEVSQALSTFLKASSFQFACFSVGQPAEEGDDDGGEVDV